MSIKKLSISILFFALMFCKVYAQQYINPEYIKVTNKRAAKIVDKLELLDSEKENIVTNIIGQQYRDLSKIHDERDAEIAKVKTSDLSEEQQNKKIDELKVQANKLVSELHKAYLEKLKKQLNEDKVIAIKDGMTYGVLPLTYEGYQDMLPNLTEAQKSFIYNNLVEARELAMDGGSSKEKHAWFGKYKGRINNYLSAQGYDLNKESKDWHKRIKERGEQK